MKVNVYGFVSIKLSLQKSGGSLINYRPRLASPQLRMLPGSQKVLFIYLFICFSGSNPAYLLTNKSFHSSLPAFLYLPDRHNDDTQYTHT